MFTINKKKMALNHFLQVPLTDAQVQSFANAQGTLDHIENFAGTAVVQCDPTGPNITASVNGANVFQARSNERFVEITEPGLNTAVRCSENFVELFNGGNVRESLAPTKQVFTDGLGNIRFVVGNTGVIVNNGYVLPETNGPVGSVLTSLGGLDTAFLPFAAATPELIANASDPATEVSVETAGFLSASVGAGKVVLVGDSAGYTLLKAPGAAAPSLQLDDSGTVELDIPGAGQGPGAVLVCTNGTGRCQWGVGSRIQDPGDPFNSFVWCDSDNISVGTNYPTGQLRLGIQGVINPGQVLTATSAAGACAWANPPVVNPFNQNLNTTNAVTFASVSTPTLGAATTNVTGTLRVSNAYSLPTTAGATGQVLTTNGVNAQWVTPTPGVFSQIGTQTVANTTAESSLIQTVGAAGSLTLPANTIFNGSSFTYQTGGVFRDNSVTTNIRFRLRNQLGVLFDTGLQALPSVPSSRAYSITLNFTYIGATSLVMNFNFTYNNGSDARGFSLQQIGAFNPALSNTLDFTAQWAVASVNNTIQTNFGVVSKLY